MTEVSKPNLEALSATQRRFIDFVESGSHPVVSEEDDFSIWVSGPLDINEQTNPLPGMRVDKLRLYHAKFDYQNMTSWMACLSLNHGDQEVLKFVHHLDTGPTSNGLFSMEANEISQPMRNQALVERVLDNLGATAVDQQG